MMKKGDWIMRHKFDNETKLKVCEMYLGDASIQQIADYFSVGYRAVRNTLIRNNIKRRNPGQRPNIPILLKGKLLELINGHLLGDGHVRKRSKNSNCSFSLGSKYYNYAKFVNEKIGRAHV